MREIAVTELGLADVAASKTRDAINNANPP
jgi:hypothetical protein